MVDAAVVVVDENQFEIFIFHPIKMGFFSHEVADLVIICESRQDFLWHSLNNFDGWKRWTMHKLTGFMPGKNIWMERMNSSLARMTCFHSWAY